MEHKVKRVGLGLKTHSSLDTHLQKIKQVLFTHFRLGDMERKKTPGSEGTREKTLRHTKSLSSCRRKHVKVLLKCVKPTFLFVV